MSDEWKVMSDQSPDRPKPLITHHFPLITFDSSLITFHSSLSPQIPPLDERPQLAVGDGALQHPEAAVRMHPLDALGAQHLDRVVDAAGDFVGLLGFVVLDVDHADAEGDAGLQVAEHVQLLVAAAGE